MRIRKGTQRRRMNRGWLAGCGVALTVWVVVALLTVFFGMTFAPPYTPYGGLVMLALALAAPSALRLIRSYRFRRFDATDILAIVFLLVALALFVWSNQQLASPRPAVF